MCVREVINGFGRLEPLELESCRIIPPQCTSTDGLIYYDRCDTIDTNCEVVSTYCTAFGRFRCGRKW